MPVATKPISRSENPTSASRHPVHPDPADARHTTSRCKPVFAAGPCPAPVSFSASPLQLGRSWPLFMHQHRLKKGKKNEHFPYDLRDAEPHRILPDAPLPRPCTGVIHVHDAAALSPIRGPSTPGFAQTGIQNVYHSLASLRCRADTCHTPTADSVLHLRRADLDPLLTTSPRGCFAFQSRLTCVF